MLRRFLQHGMTKRAGVCLALLTLAVTSLSTAEPSPSPAPPPATARPAASPDTDPAATSSRAAPGAAPTSAPANPFSYRMPEESAFIASPNVSLPADIRLLGILVMKGGKPVAAIRLPDSGQAAFVNEGSVMQVLPAGRPAGPATPAEPLYIYVNRITADEVEVSPRTRPEDRRVLR